MTPTAPAVLSVQEFRATDPEAFGAGASPRYPSRLVLRGRGRFEGFRRRLVTPGMGLAMGRTTVAATFHNAVGDRAIFSLMGGPGPEPMVQGTPMHPHVLVWWRAGGEVHTQWPAGLAWWNLVFPLERVEAAAQALQGRILVQPRGSVGFTTLAPWRRAALLAGMQAALSLPEGWDERLIADGLLRLVLEAWPDGEATGPERPARQAQAVDGLVAIAEREEAPLSLVQVCEELAVPLRTLNAGSNAILGMSAGRYLRRRRLGRVFADLRRGAASGVTDAAMRHGFWELGRFAGDYRALFGERPSDTFRRAAGGRLAG